MWMFRLPWIVYVVLAPLVFGFGIWAYFDEQSQNAERAKALSHAPPPPVKVEAFDPKAKRSDFNEVTLLAQADTAHMIEVSKTRKGRETSRSLVMPLYATTATAATGVPAAILVSDENMSDAALEKLIVEKGNFGPIMKIGGLVSDDFSARDVAKEALTKSGQYGETTTIIEPFERDRAAELQQKDNGGVMLGLGTILGLLLGAYGWFRRSRDMKAKAAQAQMMSPEAI
jgi:hypothetical protein